MVGDGLMYLLRGDFWPGLIIACVLFVVAVFVLAWPAKRRLMEETFHVPPRSVEPAAAAEVNTH